MKKIISIVLILLLSLAWFSTMTSFIKTNSAYKHYLTLAKENYENDLYQLAIENYEEALKIKPSSDKLYVGIKNAARAFYKEQQTADSKDAYVEALLKCCDLFRTDADLWEELVKVHYDSQSYSKAWTYLSKAKKNVKLNDYLKTIDVELRGKHRLLSTDFTDYRYTLSGEYVVNNSGIYWISDYSGKKAGQDYSYVGSKGKENITLFKDVTGFVFKNDNEVSLLRLDYEIEESGHMADGVMPVKIDGKYTFINKDGKNAGLGENYDYAASMYDGSAAVSKDGKWYLVTLKGKKSTSYDDIALNIYGTHTTGEFYAASTDGEYRLYNLSGKRIGKFSCSDIDIANDSAFFAFKDKKTGLWGYADGDGNVIIEPEYTEAKGFSFGYAAVKNEENLWGIIDKENTLLVPYTFADTGYFMKDETCVVSPVEGQCRIFNFLYR